MENKVIMGIAYDEKDKSFVFDSVEENYFWQNYCNKRNHNYYSIRYRIAIPRDKYDKYGSMIRHELKRLSEKWDFERFTHVLTMLI